MTDGLAGDAGAPTSGSATSTTGCARSFGDDYGLVVETDVGAGTKVTFRVPKYAPGVHA